MDRLASTTYENSGAQTYLQHQKEIELINRGQCYLFNALTSYNGGQPHIVVFSLIAKFRAWLVKSPAIVEGLINNESSAYQEFTVHLKDELLKLSGQLPENITDVCRSWFDSNNQDMKWFYTDAANKFLEAHNKDGGVNTKYFPNYSDERPSQIKSEIHNAIVEDQSLGGENFKQPFSEFVQMAMAGVLYDLYRQLEGICGKQRALEIIEKIAKMIHPESAWLQHYWDYIEELYNKHHNYPDVNLPGICPIWEDKNRFNKYHPVYGHTIGQHTSKVVNRFNLSYSQSNKLREFVEYIANTLQIIPEQFKTYLVGYFSVHDSRKFNTEHKKNPNKDPNCMQPGNQHKYTLRDWESNEEIIKAMFGIHYELFKLVLSSDPFANFRMGVCSIEEAVSIIVLKCASLSAEYSALDPRKLEIAILMLGLITWCMDAGSYEQLNRDYGLNNFDQLVASVYVQLFFQKLRALQEHKDYSRLRDMAAVCKGYGSNLILYVDDSSYDKFLLRRYYKHNPAIFPETVHKSGDVSGKLTMLPTNPKHYQYKVLELDLNKLTPDQLSLKSQIFVMSYREALLHFELVNSILKIKGNTLILVPRT